MDGFLEKWRNPLIPLRPITGAFIFRRFGHKTPVESGWRRIQGVLLRRHPMADIMHSPAKKTAGDLLRAAVYGKVISRGSFETALQIVVKEDAVHITALASHVVHPISISSERAIPHLGT